MTLALAKPGGWDEEDPLTSDEMNALQSELVKAVDGVGGGTYELASDLIFDGTAQVRIANEIQIDVGATLDMDGTLELGGQTDLTGQFDVESGADVNVKSGGEINVQTGGRIDVESGAEVNVRSGGQLDVESGGEINVLVGGEIDLAGSVEVASGGAVNVNAGGEVNVDTGAQVDIAGNLNMLSGGDLNLLSGSKITGSSGSEIQINDNDDLTINFGSYTFYASLSPIHVGAAWSSEGTGTFIVSTIAIATVPNRLVFPLLLPVGDVITTLRMTIDGGVGAGHGGGAPSDRPILELCKVALDGTLTTIQTVADPVNTGSYDNPHQVVMSGGALPYTITAERHVVRVIGEGLTGGVANTTRLCSIDGTALARSVRQTTEVR